MNRAGIAGPLWVEILATAVPAGANPYSTLTLNCANRVVGELLAVECPDTIRLVIESLYVQALLMGHHSLQAQELRLLNRGLSRLVELAVRNPT